MAENIAQNEDQNGNNANQINQEDNNFVPILNYDATNPSSLINISRDFMNKKNITKHLYI